MSEDTWSLALALAIPAGMLALACWVGWSEKRRTEEWQKKKAARGDAIRRRTRW